MLVANLLEIEHGVLTKQYFCFGSGKQELQNQEMRREHGKYLINTYPSRGKSLVSIK